MAEQHQISLSGDVRLLHALHSLKESLIERGNAAFLDELDNLISGLNYGLSTAQALDFSGTDEETLDALGITPKSLLILKPNYEGLARESRHAGEGCLWNSRHLYHHLDLLQMSIATEGGGHSRRFWVDAFLFRAAAMVSHGKCTIFKLDKTSGTPTLQSTLVTVTTASDQMAIATGSDMTAQHHRAGFLVVQPEGRGLSRYFNWAICEIYVRCKQLQQDTVRAALSDGLDWAFFILQLNQDGKGATYRWSASFSCLLDGDLKLAEPYPDIVAGILSHWIQRSCMDIDDDDWFRSRPIS